jgi:prepilin-type N-terminal cleavage/methylation domain-containing protein
MADGLTDERNVPARRARRGYSIIEVMVVLTVMVVLIGISAPSFQRALEGSNADIAIANLRAIWAAERFYWIVNRQYTGSLNDLVQLGVLTKDVETAQAPYSYSFDPVNLVATAVRSGSGNWSGQFTIDDTGAIGGSITAADGSGVISPPANQTGD